VPAPRLVRHASAACAFVAALVGCSDGGAPPQQLPPLTTSPTASATASASPSPTAEDLQQSAEQFIRAYYRALAQADRTSDPSELSRDYYDPSCRPCAFDVRTLKEFRSKQQHVEGYRSLLERVDAGELVGNTIAVTVVLRNEAGRVVDRLGKTVQTLPASGPLKVDLIVATNGQRFRIIEIVPLGQVK